VIVAENRDSDGKRVRASVAYEQEIAEKREARWQALLRADEAAATGRYPSAEEVREAALILRRGEE
jgi:hypothetical protein